MSELRSELRYETQKAYGGYCSYTRNRGKEPIPYHEFSDLYSKGMSVKEIYKNDKQQEN